MTVSFIMLYLCNYLTVIFSEFPLKKTTGDHAVESHLQDYILYKLRNSET